MKSLSGLGGFPSPSLWMHKVPSLRSSTASSKKACATFRVWLRSCRLSRFGNPKVWRSECCEEFYGRITVLRKNKRVVKTVDTAQDKTMANLCSVSLKFTQHVLQSSMAGRMTMDHACVVNGNQCNVRVPLEPPARQMQLVAPGDQIAVLDDPRKPKDFQCFSGSVSGTIQKL